jgi:hypothetical protein
MLETSYSYMKSKFFHLSSRATHVEAPPTPWPNEHSGPLHAQK